MFVINYAGALLKKSTKNNINVPPIQVKLLGQAVVVFVDVTYGEPFFNLWREYKSWMMSSHK